ncbi:hypothetical protein OS128_00255 [Corynebacterium sp. P5848]|uniref:hypothetical protein n=1 Tax=Corynebacterium marambiense TaxID=2765364 RepID=UPI002260FBB8|nr:hypothetical protein [Corynebacterium marambiense]MCX7541350.1 hypothetical protein [Corynebacterium marambiense]
MTVTDRTSPAVDSVEHIEVVVLPQENPERAKPTRVVRGPQWESAPEAGTAATTTTGGAQSVQETTTTTPEPAPAPAAPAEGQPVSNVHAAAVSPRLVNAVATQPAPTATTTTTAAVEESVAAPQESAVKANQPQ